MGSPRQSLSRGTRGGETLSDTEIESDAVGGSNDGNESDDNDKGDGDSSSSSDDDDDGDEDGGDEGESQPQRRLSPFTGEGDFDHAT